jgi:tetratricopeptide (TPR) repeat protein
MNLRQMEIGFISIAFVCVTLVPSHIHADDMNKIRKELEDLYKTSINLPSLYLKTDRLNNDRYVAERFVDGENFYRIKDYERAAVIFLDIIENYTNYSVYIDALFLYADALFLSGDVLAAKQAFERFITESNRQDAARFKERALERLIEIAVRTDSFEGMDQYLMMLKQYPTEAARYTEGKFFYFKKDFTRAQEALGAVHKDSQLNLKAQYLIGAIFTINGRFEDALSVFAKVLSGNPVTSENRDIIDLVNLGAARLNYELGRFDDALKSYRQIKESSPYYDSSLYESASSMFQAGDASRAEQTLEVLTTSVPDSRYFLRAKMLRGNLLLRDNQFDEAEELFNKMVQEFTPMISRLNPLIERQEGPSHYLGELVESNISSLDIAGVLPPLVLKSIEDEPEVKRALNLNSEFDDAENNLRETKRLMHLIEAVIKGRNSSDIIPFFREGKRRGSILINRLSQLRFVLSAMGEERVKDDSSELSSLRSRRIQLSEKIYALPTDEEEFVSREDESKEVFFRMNAELQRNAIRLDQSDATVTAIVQFIDDARYREGISKEAIEAVKQELIRIRTANAGLRVQLSDLRNAVEEARYQVRVGDSCDEIDAKVRDDIRVLSNKERTIFEKVKGRFAKELGELFRRIDEIEATVFDFDKKMTNESIIRMEKIRSQLFVELENLRNCDEQAARLRGEIKEVVGGVTFENLSSVRKRFLDLVIKADVGILDSAWLRKETHTSKISKLNEERLEEIQNLERDFQEMTSQQDSNVE